MPTLFEVIKNRFPEVTPNCRVDDYVAGIIVTTDDWFRMIDTYESLPPEKQEELNLDKIRFTLMGIKVTVLDIKGQCQRYLALNSHNGMVGNKLLVFLQEIT